MRSWSYLTHDKRRDFDADLDLYKKLVSTAYASPLEQLRLALLTWEQWRHHYLQRKVDCMRCNDNQRHGVTGWCLDCIIAANTRMERSIKRRIHAGQVIAKETGG